MLAGCVGEKIPDAPLVGAASVYVLSDWASNQETDSLLSVNHLIPDEDDVVAFCLKQLFLLPRNEQSLSPFPPDTTVVSHTLRDGLLTVDISEEFKTLSGPSLTLAEACLALTLCALPEVSAVQITVDGAPWPTTPAKSRFSAADFPLDTLVLKPVDQPLTLFFVDPDTMTLESEVHLVIKRETEPTERYVMEKLLSGPLADDLMSALPADAPLLSVTTENDICYVNFSAAFYQIAPPFTHSLTIRAITRSLTALPDIRAVQFLKDGQVADLYGSVYLAEPLS